MDSNGNTATNYGVRSIPTLLIFQNGTILNQIVGNVAKVVCRSNEHALNTNALSTNSLSTNP